MAAAIKFIRPIRTARQLITAAEIVALGANLTGTIVLAPVLGLPAKARILDIIIRNQGNIAATLATLTAQVGDSSDPNRYVLDGTIFAADAVVGGIPADVFGSQTVDTPLEILFTGNANLGTLTGLTDGVVVEINYIEGT